MLTLRASLLLLVSAAYLIAADDQETGLSVTISSAESTYRNLGDAVLEIHISNTTAHRITVKTMDADPPVVVFALDAIGKMAIEEPVLTKSGKSANPALQTKNVDYALGPSETRSYRKTVLESMDKGQILQARSKPPITVTLMLPVVRYEQSAYHVILVKSNSIEIEINPSLPQP